ncbi:MAG: metallophosphoesterase [Hyphomicrobiaceae bacterium]
MKGAAAFAASASCFAGYAFAVEPLLRLEITRYPMTPHGWPPDLKLRLAVLADIHAGDPYMSLSRIAGIVARANALNPDAHLLLGDYMTSHRWQTRRIRPEEWAPVLAGLKAPLGVHAVLGNHDWWEDHAAQQRQQGPIESRRALERNGIPVYENDVVRLQKDGRSFWLAGLGDQIAFRSRRRAGFTGVDDLKGTLAKVTDASPVILMAHEPDIFPQVPSRVALTVSGHTHGGQVRLLGYSPVVPSRFGNRYAYGHVVETRTEGPQPEACHLVVSGGLGCSIAPVRLFMPPEIVVLELGGTGV